MQFFKGGGFGYIRLPMGACDLSSKGDFSYNDVPAGQTDTSLSKFSVSPDESYIIPFL